MNSPFAFFASSIGKKWVVALTGIVLMLFLVGHLTGNLLIFLGPDAINDYAVFLHGLAHGAGIWIARIVLLACVVAHVTATLQLVRANRAAREVRYLHEATVQASRASRTMAASGLVILAFVIYHILHFTVGLNNEYYVENGPYYLPNGHHDVYKMVVDGFSNLFVSGFYILAIGLLCLHLSHGFSSVFQTLGLRTERSWPAILRAGHLFAAVLFLGNISIPLSVLFGFVS